MRGLLSDIRYALRQMRKNLGFTAVAALTLALGIGANSAIFSLVSGILLRPLPFSKPHELVAVMNTYPSVATYPRGGLVAMRDQLHTMDVAAYAEGHEFDLTGIGEPLRLTGTLVSAEFFSVLGVRPLLGRTFYPREDAAGQDQYVLLSYALWQQRFGGDSSIVGRPIEIGGVSRQVLGVLPADFQFPSARTQVWLPLHNDPSDNVGYWATDFMPVIGRLRPGVSLPQASADARMFQSHVRELFPWPMPADWNANVSVVSLQTGIVADVRTRLLLLLGSVGLVLLIACANVANLALSRSASREREIGIRTALGAGRRRIVRQLLTESLALSLFGGLLGLLLAGGGLSLLKSFLPADTPRLQEAHLDWRVLAFTAGVSVLTGFAFGLAPALQYSRASLSESLRSGGRGAAKSVSQGLRGALAVGEVAFAMMLVIAAGLLIRSFWALSHVDPGFQPERVITARITPTETFCSDVGRCLNFYRSLLEQTQAAGGVSGASLVNTLPLGGRVAKRSMQLEDYVSATANISPLFWMNIVTSDYFRVMGIPLREGSGFTKDQESANAAVVVVSAETARLFWPGQSAVGKHLRLLNEREWRTVVGVANDVRAYDLQRNAPDWIKGTAYVLLGTNSTLEDRRIPTEMTITVRTVLDESHIQDTLRRTIDGLNHEVPISEVRTMKAVVSEAASTSASTTSLFIAFAALALALGMIGIYGVLAFLVSKRTREIGIRLALGAQRGDVFWLVTKEGAKFYGAGVVVGLAGAFVATRWLASELYGVSSVDWLTYSGVAVVMAVATGLACYVPARNAMRVDPLIALRYE